MRNERRATHFSRLARHVSRLARHVSRCATHSSRFAAPFPRRAQQFPRLATRVPRRGALFLLLARRSSRRSRARLSVPEPFERNDGCTGWRNAETRRRPRAASSCGPPTGSRSWRGASFVRSARSIRWCVTSSTRIESARASRCRCRWSKLTSRRAREGDRRTACFRVREEVRRRGRERRSRRMEPGSRSSRHLEPRDECREVRSARHPGAHHGGSLESGLRNARRPQRRTSDTSRGRGASLRAVPPRPGGAGPGMGTWPDLGSWRRRGARREGRGPE